MTNNTTNEDTNVTSNATADDVSESGMLDGLMDAISDSPELFVALLAIGLLAAYIAYTQPAVKKLIMPYLKKYDDQIIDTLDKHMTAAQVKAYEKLDELAQKHVKDAMLKNVILSVYDQNDDKFAAVVKTEVKEALVNAKKL
jgi:hypothetical protein|tara:strand:+ start:1125 stop:1550 length:426 start_codon:yes stop_codon:yes gene_type:complete